VCDSPLLSDANADADADLDFLQSSMMESQSEGEMTPPKNAMMEQSSGSGGDAVRKRGRGFVYGRTSMLDPPPPPPKRKGSAADEDEDEDEKEDEGEKSSSDVIEEKQEEAEEEVEEEVEDGDEEEEEEESTPLLHQYTEYVELGWRAKKGKKAGEGRGGPSSSSFFFASCHDTGSGGNGQSNFSQQRQSPYSVYSYGEWVDVSTKFDHILEVHDFDASVNTKDLDQLIDPFVERGISTSPLPFPHLPYLSPHPSPSHNHRHVRRGDKVGGRNACPACVSHGRTWLHSPSLTVLNKRKAEFFLIFYAHPSLANLDLHLPHSIPGSHTAGGQPSGISVAPIRRGE